MKKIMIMILALLMIAFPVTACPLWECQYDVNDYNCGCGSRSTCYNETSVRQPIYCQYCGNETWNCVCDNDYSYSSGCVNYDYDYDYDTDCYSGGCTSGCTEEYSCTGGYQMTHWANVRDEYGNIIGQVGCGSSVEVIGIDSDNPDRVLIYDYSTGTYGSVLSSCVYGGYEWDGTGDNGEYNSYQGNGCVSDYTEYNDYDYDGYTGGYDYDYGYDCQNSGYGYGYGSGYGCNAYSNAYYVAYCETVIQRCVTYAYGGGYSCGYKRGWC